MLKSGPLVSWWLKNGPRLCSDKKMVVSWLPLYQLMNIFSLRQTGDHFFVIWSDEGTTFLLLWLVNFFSNTILLSFTSFFSFSGGHLFAGVQSRLGGADGKPWLGNTSRQQTRMRQLTSASQAWLSEEPGEPQQCIRGNKSKIKVCHWRF